MTTALPPVGDGAHERARLLAGAAIVGVALLAGLAIGDRSTTWVLPFAVIAGGGVLFAGARWPFASLLLMLGSSILLVVVRASGVRAVNAFDVLLPPVLLASMLGTARRDALAQVESGAEHERLRAAEKRFVLAVVLFHVAAALSLVQLAVREGVYAGLDSGLLLIRAIQGLLIYPLCIWWLRTRARVYLAWRAIFVAGIALAVVNVLGVFAWGVGRAGMTLYLNDPKEPLASPNEAGAATLIVGAVLVIRQAMRPDWKNGVLGVLMLVVLVLTQSRSSLLAWLTFALFSLRRLRPAQLLTGASSLVALLALLPQAGERLARSAAVERGSFEVYSFLQRVYAWRTAWRVFEDYPWTGIGYLGFRFISHRYNEFRLKIVTVDNYYFEILVSMGIVGLAVLGLVLVRLFQLGREVGRVAPPGTLAHHMARFHAPLVSGLLVANLTGDNLVGLVSLTQMALWTAVLVRSGHAAVEGARE